MPRQSTAAAHLTALAGLFPLPMDANCRSSLRATIAKTTSPKVDSLTGPRLQIGRGLTIGDRLDKHPWRRFVPRQNRKPLWAPV